MACGAPVRGSNSLLQGVPCIRVPVCSVLRLHSWSQILACCALLSCPLCWWAPHALCPTAPPASGRGPPETGTSLRPASCEVGTDTCSALSVKARAVASSVGNGTTGRDARSSGVSQAGANAVHLRCVRRLDRARKSSGGRRQVAAFRLDLRGRISRLLVQQQGQENCGWWLLLKQVSSHRCSRAASCLLAAVWRGPPDEACLRCSSLVDFGKQEVPRCTAQLRQGRAHTSCSARTHCKSAAKRPQASAWVTTTAARSWASQEGWHTAESQQRQRQGLREASGRTT